MKTLRPFTVLAALALCALPGSTRSPAIAAPPAWSPTPAGSPLREIWSFDTKG